MSYQVRRGFETVATANATSESVARDQAIAAVRDSIEAAATDGFPLVSVEMESQGIYEFPSGPFDPHRFTVHGSVTVSVTADDDATAREDGTTAIETLLDRADLDDLAYRGETTVEATA